MDFDRKLLIDCIVNKGKTIKQSAIETGISYENAKAIYRIYRLENRIGTATASP
jgi:hypothetical protein